MDQRTQELRRDMEIRRQNVGRTVDEIENRVNPRHVAVRQGYRVRRKLGEWKDRIMGQFEDVKESGDERMAGVSDSVKDLRGTVTRRTRGNPLAVGAIALGAGALLAALLPESRQERRMAEKVQPGMEEVAGDLANAGREVANDLQDSAQASASRLRESAEQSGREVSDEVRRSTDRLSG